MNEYPKFYCLTVVKSENDFCWFTVESDYVTLFIIKFFKKARKVEKVLGRGLFTVFGYVPTIMLAKLVTKFDFVELDYNGFRKKRSEQIRELKV